MLKYNYDIITPDNIDDFIIDYNPFVCSKHNYNVIMPDNIPNYGISSICSFCKSICTPINIDYIYVSPYKYYTYAICNAPICLISHKQSRIYAISHYCPEYYYYYHKLYNTHIIVKHYQSTFCDNYNPIEFDALLFPSKYTYRLDIRAPYVRYGKIRMIIDDPYLKHYDIYVKVADLACWNNIDMYESHNNHIMVVSGDNNDDDNTKHYTIEI